MKVLMLPHPSQISGNRASGIDQVVINYARHLPDFGIDLVSPDAENYDLIASHAGLTGPVCDVCHLHGLHWTADYDAPDWEYRVNARIVEAVRHAKIITVPSDWVAETIRRDLRVNPTVIPHGIDWQDWQHDEPRGDYVLWNKNRADPWVCNPMPVVYLANKFPKAHFVTTFLPDKVGPANNTNVIGLIPHAEMKKLVQSALIYLATTKETWGIGILEAMAAGVPILGYAHGGILDLVEHGVSGYLARPGDIDDLAEGLAYCIQHRQVLGENGREIARGWTWEAAVSCVAEVYRQAAEKDPPTVGVVIPVYDKTEQELKRAIDSVGAQSLQPAQIVVIDDGSQQDYAGLLAEYPGVTYLRQNNQGVANARNNGIAQLQTKYVCCLDADDWLEPDFLRICVAALEADRSLGIAYTGLRWHKPDGTTGISEWPGQWDYNKQLQRQNQVPTCCVFRRDMWQRLGGYRQRYAPRGAGAEDEEFWLRSGAHGWKAAKVTEDTLFDYSWLSGLVSPDVEYVRKIDVTLWHPWTKDAQHPFASYATPPSGPLGGKRLSHPVRAYDQPAVSVIIPVGPGHEREVINALDSLEAQTFRQWEVIVVWDGPVMVHQKDGKWLIDNDDIAKVQVAYPYAKFRATGAKARGAGWARNFGVTLARAPFLLFLDADDWLYPEAIQKMVNAWNAHQAIVYTDYVGKAIVDDPGKLAADLRERLYHYDEKRQEAVIGYRAFDFDCEQALRQPELPQPYIWCNVTALIPRSWHDEIGGFDEAMESWEDVDYHWRHARAGHCYYHLSEELMVYRFYTGSRRDKGLQNHENLVQYISRKYEKEGDSVGCRGCPGGGRTSKIASTPAPIFAGSSRGMKLAAMPGADGDFIKVKYVKPLRGSHEVIGSNAINPTTGRKFSYGQHSFGDIFLVHRDDIYMVDRRSGTQVLRDPSRFQVVEERVVEPPDTGLRETPAPVAIAKETPGVTEITEWIHPDGTRFVPLPTAEHDMTMTLVEEVQPLPFDPQMLPGVNAKVAAALVAAGLVSREAIQAAGVAGLQDVPGIGERKAHKIMEYLSK